MAKHSQQAGGAQQPPASAQPESATVRVRGRALIPIGIGSESYRDATGTLRPDPGRLRAGFWWPREFVEHDVPRELLPELEADAHIESSWEGKAAKVEAPAEPDAGSIDWYRRTLADTEARLRATERRLIDAEARTTTEVALARREAQTEIAHMRQGYEKRIAELETEIKHARGAAPNRQRWFPSGEPNAAHDEDAA